MWNDCVVWLLLAAIKVCRQWQTSTSKGVARRFVSRAIVMRNEASRVRGADTVTLSDMQPCTSEYSESPLLPRSLLTPPSKSNIINNANIHTSSFRVFNSGVHMSMFSTPFSDWACAGGSDGITAQQKIRRKIKMHLRALRTFYYYLKKRQWHRNNNV